MRRFIFTITITLIIVVGFLAGSYLYRIERNKKSAMDSNIEKSSQNNMNEVTNSIVTSSAEEKASPNTTLTIKKLYTECNHILEKSEKISVELANLNQEEFQKEFSDWEIQKFTNTGITLYKEVPSYCGEHYSLKDLNGFIAIYKLNENDIETKLIKVTEIPIEYLAEKDKENIENGMKVYTKKELNKTLEDFE